MMEPSVRIETNRLGFCEKHFGKMLKNGKRLPVALILQSHLEEIRAELAGAKADGAEKYLSRLERTCYVCARVETNMQSVLSNIFYLWSGDEKFRRLFSEQPYFCITRYRALLSCSEKALSKKERSVFYESISLTERNYLASLSGDIDWFCKKFDYRFAKEDWKNSRDAIERTVYALTSHLPEGRGEG
jgi:hypothetical protein